jgi:formimidoylglutamate deiminase
MLPSALQPERLYAQGRILRDVSLNVDERGCVRSIGPAQEGAQRVRLAGKLLLPGLVNAHSHAFQRTLRGRTEWRRDGAAESFWSWREQMYRVAERLDPEGLRAAARLAFVEMLSSGITAVGEFHYLHRDPSGAFYDDPNELAWQIRAAAEETGIRLVLLRAAYRRGGRSEELQGPQRRFDSGSSDEFLRDMDALSARASRDGLFGVGLAPHSVRAVPAELLATLAGEARRRGWPLHMHVAEQPAEVSACLEEYGRRPVELLTDLELLSPSFTAVHAVEVLPHEAADLGRARVTVCACPTTERNLGDGVVPARLLRDSGATLALGTDSQAQIDLLEDARELESHLRLTTGERAVLAERGDDPTDLARTLFAAASSGGARALGLPVGDLVAGAPADYFTVDLGDPAIAGCDDESLLAALVFGSSVRGVRDVAVGGRLLVQDGRHAGAETAVADFQRLQERLWQ